MADPTPKQPNSTGDLSEVEYRAAYDLVADACDGDMGPGGEALDALIAAGWRPPDRTYGDPPNYVVVGAGGRPVARRVTIDESINVDLDSDGHAVGVELIGRDDWHAIGWAIITGAKFA